MKHIALLLMTIAVGLLWLPLPLKETAGGEAWAQSPPQQYGMAYGSYYAGPSTQASPREGEGQEPVIFNDDSAPAFLTIDLTIDPKGQPLGAYQIEMTSADKSFSVVGVEAGDHAAFDHGRPPYFDPIAQQDGTDRLILAEYAKPDLKADQLPTDPVRVATVHVMIALANDQALKPFIQLKLTTAGNADGERIEADISYHIRTPGIAPERPSPR